VSAAILLCLNHAVAGQTNALAEVLKDYANEHNFDNAYNHLIWNTVRDALTSGPYRGRVTINSSSPQPDTINIFVLARDPGKYFTRIGCNCAYIGQIQAVICDHTLLDYFALLLNLSPSGASQLRSSETAYVNSFASEFLLHWIFAHEIGHVVGSHGTAAGYYFHSDSASTSNSSPKIDSKEEVAADIFAAGSIQSPTEQQMAWLTLGDVIKTLYTDALSKQSALTGENAPAPKQLDELIFGEQVHLTVPDTGDPHPPWLVRALNFEETLRSQYPGTVFDNTGYYPKMIRSITVSADRTQPSSLCNMDLQIERETVLVKLSKPLATDNEMHDFRTRNLLRIAAYQATIDDASQWIVSLFKNVKQTPADLARPYSVRGEALAAVGRFSDAAPDFEKALKYTPSDESLHDNLGFSYYEMSQPSRAIEQWKIAIKLKADLADAWAGLGIAYFSVGQRRDGLAKLGHALSLEPLYALPDFLRYEAFWSERQIATEQTMVGLLRDKK
jgi:tetratricopeptide (TPR) repeat protein